MYYINHVLLWALVALSLAATGGWIMNIVKLAQCDFASPYKAEMFRIVGVAVPPVGAVLGYMDLGQ